MAAAVAKAWAIVGALVVAVVVDDSVAAVGGGIIVGGDVGDFWGMGNCSCRPCP